jgi:hypothetical protein
LARDWHWLTQHIILIFVLSAIACGGVYAFESLIAKHDDKVAAQYSARLALDQQTLKTLQDQFVLSTAQHAQEIALLTAQNAQLSQVIAKRDSQLAQQVKLDATLNAQAVAERLVGQLQVQPSEVTASGDTVNLDLPAARTATADLDRLPVAQADLANTQAQLANETKVADAAKADATDARQIIAGQQTEIADQQKACDAQIKKVKADARKSKWKYLLFGGAIAEALRIYLTHGV